MFKEMRCSTNNFLNSFFFCIKSFWLEYDDFFFFKLATVANWISGIEKILSVSLEWEFIHFFTNSTKHFIDSLILVTYLYCYHWKLIFRNQLQCDYYVIWNKDTLTFTIIQQHQWAFRYSKVSRRSYHISFTNRGRQSWRELTFDILLGLTYFCLSIQRWKLDIISSNHIFSFNIIDIYLHLF